MNEILESAPSENKGSQTQILSGKGVNSLDELRENFDIKELVSAFENGALENWLKTNYYEREAKEISMLEITSPTFKKNLCKALGIKLEKRLNAAEKEALDKKLSALRGISADEKMLENAGLFAFDQAELAALINAGEKEIYLFKNTFSIPLSVDEMTYHATFGATISHPYTRKQYEKLGIKIDGTELPESVEEDYYFLKAAKAAGYDDFMESHNEFATAIHNLLKSGIISKPVNLPSGSIYKNAGFHSYTECEAAKTRCIREIYDTAQSYFDTNSSKSAIKFAAEKYAGIINTCFSPIMDGLNIYCEISGLSSEFKQLSELVNNASKALLKELENEAFENNSYYDMYDFDYFANQMTIEKHDYRASDSAFVKFMEAMFTDSIEYSFEGGYETVCEMEKDLNSQLSSFYKTAHGIYYSYVKSIEDVAEKIGGGFVGNFDGKSLSTYVLQQYHQKITVC